MYKNISSFLLIALLCLRSFNVDGKIAPFYMKFLVVRPCDDEGERNVYFSDIQLTVSKKSDPTLMSATFTVKNKLDDNTQVVAEVIGPDNDKTKANIGGACSFLKHAVPAFWKNLLKAWGTSDLGLGRPPKSIDFSIKIDRMTQPYSDCPLKKGSQRVANAKINPKMNVPAAPLGNYTIDIVFVNKKNVRVGCYQSVVEFKEKT